MHASSAQLKSVSVGEFKMRTQREENLQRKSNFSSHVYFWTVQRRVLWLSASLTQFSILVRNKTRTPQPWTEPDRFICAAFCLDMFTIQRWRRGGAVWAENHSGWSGRCSCLMHWRWLRREWSRRLRCTDCSCPRRVSRRICCSSTATCMSSPSSALQEDVKV